MEWQFCSKIVSKFNIYVEVGKHLDAFISISAKLVAKMETCRKRLGRSSSKKSKIYKKPRGSRYTSPRRILSGSSAFRRDFSENEFEEEECKIVFYPRPHFQGSNQTLVQGRKYVSPGEKSIRTFGSCCWILFK